MRFEGVGLASVKAAIVLVPSYLAAFLTEQMVWVVPTLAASSFMAATLRPVEVAQRTEQDGASGEDGPSVDG